MKNILPLPNLPKLSDSFPKVVEVFDRIRFNLDESNEYDEFYLFAREYPRCYRYHLSCAEFRLEGIYKKYQAAHTYYSHELRKGNENCSEIIHGKQQDFDEIYWDFEAFLSAINTALDLLARIMRTAYIEEMPLSFNKLCKKNLNGPAIILKKAQKVWVSRMKDYRDCFIHYTPVDPSPHISVKRYSNGWKVRGKLPNNPNVRDTFAFKYSRKVELLRYAISIFKHMIALDSAVSKEIYKLYKAKQFPKRINNLFFLGKRVNSNDI